MMPSDGGDGGCPAGAFPGVVFGKVVAATSWPPRDPGRDARGDGRTGRTDVPGRILPRVAEGAVGVAWPTRPREVRTMKAWSHADYAIDLPPHHPFPMGKFPALRRILLGEGIVAAHEIFEPPPIEIDRLRSVHADAYLEALAGGTLTRDEERRLGLPWSEALWRRSRLATAGTLLAADAAIEDGLAANLAGGTHHAHPDAGEGFCVLNDTAVAIHHLRSRGRARRFLVIDLDVHQGNGNSACLGGDPETFTFSMHGERNFPLRKVPSTLDVGLPDHTGDREYLDRLARHLPEAIDGSRPDLAFYLAGVDVVVGDRYGRLALTREGLRQRDAMVASHLHAAGIPMVLTLAGGYARTPELTADLHATAHREAAAVWRRR